MAEPGLVKDVVFRFKYTRPRILLGVATFFVAYAVWLGINPTEIDVGHATGAIDFFIRSMPTPARVVSCCALAVLLFWSAYITYWPCIRDGSIIIFDGRTISGYDFWGNKSSVLRSQIEAVSYRSGGVSIKAEQNNLWLPLSLLDTDTAHLDSIKYILNNACC